MGADLQCKLQENCAGEVNRVQTALAQWEGSAGNGPARSESLLRNSLRQARPQAVPTLHRIVWLKLEKWEGCNEYGMSKSLASVYI